MTDWHRMEWRAKANIWASRIRVLCILALAPEVYEILKYHFPWYDDIMPPLTLALHQLCGFVQRKTEMYRIDL